MTVSKERKAELTAQFGNTPVDTGNPKVQVAILSERIKELTEHMKSHQKDFHTRRGLLMLVGRRRRRLKNLEMRIFDDLVRRFEQRVGEIRGDDRRIVGRGRLGVLQDVLIGDHDQFVENVLIFH